MTLTRFDVHSTYLCRGYLFGLALVMAARVSAQEPAEETSVYEDRYAEARTRVERAKHLFDVHNYEAAFVDFMRAHALLEGHERRYVVLYNLAICAERLFRYDEALNYYERYLADGGPHVENGEEIRNLVESLRRLLAVVQVDTSVRGELWVDDRRLVDVPGQVRLPAGRHVIEVRARNHQSVRRELLLEAGSQTRLQLDLPPLSSYRGIKREFFYGGTVLTGVALLTAITFGAVTLSERGYARDLAQDTMHLRTSELNHALDRVDGWALATDLTFAGTAVLGAATLLLFALSDWNDTRSGEAAPTREREIGRLQAPPQARSYW